MPFEFVDRVPTKQGRVKITPENGGTPYYAVVERADEPAVAGSPLSAANLNAAQEPWVFLNATSVSTSRSVYISTTGNDNNAGTASSPMATIKGAIRKFAKRHKYMDLYLADGTYTEDIGTITTDNCSLSIRSTSENRDGVVINISTTLETLLNQLRLYNITLNMTATGTRVVTVNGGSFFCHNVCIKMPATSTATCINVNNGSSAVLSESIIDSGTTAAVYANRALCVRAYNCTSTRTVALAFHALNSGVIEYTPTMTATTMTKEETGGKCIKLDARAGASRSSFGTSVGQYLFYDKLLVQWGSVDITPTASNEATTKTVSFPIAYANTPVVVVSPVTTVPNNTPVGVLRGGTYVSDPKKEFAIVLVRNGTSTTTVQWIAIGQGA